MNSANPKYFEVLLKLAHEAKKIAKPNPAVAAIIVRDQKIIGQGHTREWGKEHAEIMALNSVQDKKNLLTSEMWVTLSPCHFQGKTPPCTKAIVNSGIKVIHIALKDPHPQVGLLSHEYLKSKGIKVVDDFPLEMKWQHFKLNYDFFKKQIIKMPAVTLKYAMTLDGKIATHNFDSKWITNDKARAQVQADRQKSDAILIGANTLFKDNPRLNVRREKTSFQPLIIVWFKGIKEEQLKRLRKLNVVRNDSPVVFVVPKETESYFSAALKRASKKINFLTYPTRDSQPNNASPSIFSKTFIKKLGREFNLNSIYVEGGAKTLSFFFSKNLADRLDLYLGNKIMNDGKNALSPFYHHFSPLKKLPQDESLAKMEVSSLEGNLKISGFLRSSSWLKIWQEVANH